MNALRPSAPSARDPARAGGRRALSFLADLSQSLAVSLDLKTTLKPALARIMDFMQAEGASLFLLDPATNLLECKICAGPVDIVGLKLEVGQGVVGRSVAENAPQRVDDARRDARVNARVDAETGFVTRAILCVPLATAQGPIGALEIINRRDGGAFDEDDAEVLRLIAAPMALAINNARLALEVAEQQRIRREMLLARTIQKSLLPKRRRGRFPLIGVNLPAHEISGDFYDYFDLPDGRLAFFIGDISGKGLDAAFLMVRVASLLRWSGGDAPAPAAWLTEVNAELCRTLQNGRFVCAVVGIYDRNKRAAIVANAGFPPALLDDGKDFVELPADGPPLGIVKEAQYGERAIDLGASALYLFSDGATDVREDARSRLGADGLRGLIRRYAALAPEPRLRALLGELKRRRLVDDTTLLLLQEPRGSEVRELLALRFPARPIEMRAVRAALRAALDAEEVSPELRDRLVLVVDEACTNIIRHAYCHESGEVAPDCECGSIALRATREHDMLSFELRDEAPAVDPARIKPRDLSECRPGGLGVAFIDATMDVWRVEALAGGRGNRLIMQKRLAPKSENE
ncbi:MAG: SpoIIE family protein phosphatase [Rudaea sp.]|uniref:ATP-binding SpoIIE family protein phosphatase n=1 Tax=unclassified Rudaea TaxID=2627037 RepID=UPI0010F86C96|nr:MULTISPECIES: SpoIIE family protein phosphatase [unclassified Rudaea]MBN8885963.1 SpoIIE family protein phosphatase [Rudaea sp.]